MSKKYKFFPSKSLGRVEDELEERNYYESEEISGEKKQKNPVLPWVIITIIFLALGVKLFQLQVKEGFSNLTLAEGNRVKNIPTSGARGIIIDSKGQTLANNTASYELITRITKVRDLEKIDSQIFSIIGMTKEEVIEEITKQAPQSGYTVLKDKIARDDALIMKSKLPVYGEFEIDPIFLRQYTQPSLCHVLGYVGKVSSEEQESKPIAAINGYSGKSGLEKTYDDYLQGIPGSHKVEVDANNNLVQLLTDSTAQIGKTIKTTLDKDLQDFAYQRLKQETDDKQTQGAIIAMDPKTGGIKAMISIPLYDNGKLSGGITQDELNAIFDNPSKPFLNRAISGSYPSGSTIKPFIATTALDAGVISESTSFHTPPFIEIGGHKFPDWKDHSGESTNVETAIAQSNNVFFYSIGGGNPQSPISKGLGPDGIYNGLEKFGFGRELGIDLSSESSGFIPTTSWKKRTTGENWYIGDTYNLSIGQGGLQVTPLQIADATSVIANGGKLFRPYLVNEILDSEGKKVAVGSAGSHLIDEDMFSKDNLSIVRDGMRQTTQSGGSAYTVFGPNFPLEVAAKTGTAQFGTEDKTHAWFTSFAPFDDPQIVVTVIVEGAGEGFEAAAPVAKDILAWWNDHK